MVVLETNAWKLFAQVALPVIFQILENGHFPKTF